MQSSGSANFAAHSQPPGRLSARRQMAVEVGEIRKEGWVNKESAVIRSYRKRWMVLTPDHLYSFKREKQYSDPTEVSSVRVVYM